MKRKILPSLLLLASLTACDNGNIGMSTFVHEDGTCHREICFKANGDPAADGIPNTLPENMTLPDDGWTLEIYDTTWVKASRDFASADEMTETLPLQVAGQQIKSKATLERHFRWFYTDYVYTETFESLIPLFDIPLSDYMTEDMANFWLTGTPEMLKGYSGLEMKDYLDNMEDAFYHFVNANLMSDLVGILADHYDAIPNPPMDKETFLAKRTELIELSNKTSNDILSFEPDSILTVVLETKAYAKAVKEVPEIAEAWELRQNVYVALLTLDVDCQLNMPGGIIEVLKCRNAIFREGGLHYRLSGLRLLAPSYTIKATSCGKNNWMLNLTFALVLVAIGLGIYLRWGRKAKETA